MEEKNCKIWDLSTYTADRLLKILGPAPNGKPVWIQWGNPKYDQGMALTAKQTREVIAHLQSLIAEETADDNEWEDMVAKYR